MIGKSIILINFAVELMTTSSVFSLITFLSFRYSQHSDT